MHNYNLFAPGLYLIFAHHLRYDIHRHGEDDGAVVLGRDTGQGLKVAQLKRKVLQTPMIEHFNLQRGGTIDDNLRGVSEGSAGLVLPLGRYHLGEAK